MDRVTRTLMRTYASAAGLSGLAEHAQFERFATHIALTKAQNGSFSADDFCVGDGVQGIDAAALNVNGELVRDLDDLEAVLEEAHTLTFEILLLQAKTSSKFDLGDLSVFADMAKSLVLGQYDGTDARLEAFSRTLEEVYNRSQMFTDNPVLKLYYVTTGNWDEPSALASKMKAVERDIVKSNMVSRVDFLCWGAAEVQKYWRAIDSGLTKTFLFENKTTLPDMPGIQEAYLGILPADQLVSLITDEDDEIRKALFYDNVRDFQGDVDVNSDIRLTLQSSERTKFCVLNNGITLVARAVKTTANRFTVSDYQIVNGCQTSHVLHQERGSLEGVYVPFRLIVTDDDDVAKAITTATNKQTQVSRENLLALLDEQKQIEQYFNAFSGDEAHRVFYERRSKQWVGSSQIRGAWRIITLRNLMQSFASMYLKIPHTAARYYPDLRDRAAAEVFTAEHHPAYFYSAGYAYCKLDHFFRSQLLGRELKPARYHLLAGLRVWATGSKAPDVIESKEVKAERDLEDFNALLWDDERLLAVLREVAEVIIEEAGGQEITRDFGRNREQTDQLLEKVLLRRAATSV